MQIYDPSQQKPLEKITVSESATHHLKKEMTKQPGAIGIHFGVKKSGCSGWRYVIEVITAPIEDAHVFSDDPTLTIYVDKKSYPFIKGTHLNYVKRGLNEMFEFKNPNQSGNCGCGESFSIEEE